MRVIANCFKHNNANADKHVCFHYPNISLNEELNLDFSDFTKDIIEIKVYYNQLSLYFILYSSELAMQNIVNAENSDLITESLREIAKESISMFKEMRTQIANLNILTEDDFNEIMKEKE